MKKLASFTVLGIFFLVFINFKLTVSADKPKSISIDEFPLTVGSQWTYVRTDSLFEYGERTRTVAKETMTVQIASEHLGNNKEKIFEWVRNFVTSVDTEYAVIQGDTIMLANSLDPVKSSVAFHFVFPMKVGDGWSGPSTFRDSDYYEVMEQESVRVPAGSFADAYLIQRVTGELHNFTFVNYWIVPKMGIVKMSISGIFFNRGIEYYPTGSFQKNFSIWELIKYDIRK